MSRRCPNCERPTELAFAPFCSRRCADVDLQRWFSGTYALPGEGATEESAGPTPEDEED